MKRFSPQFETPELLLNSAILELDCGFNWYIHYLFKLVRRIVTQNITDLFQSQFYNKLCQAIVGNEMW